jgi:hypothetical protein
MHTAEESAPAAQRSGGIARTVVLIGEASLTAVALGVGIGFWASSRKASDDADSLTRKLQAAGGSCGGMVPANFTAACSALSDARDRQRNHEKVAIAGFIGAGVGAAATVTTFLLWKPSPSSTALGVNFTPLAKGGALELRGRF